jgi:hypothetical protein
LVVSSVTDRMASQSRCEIQVQASHRRILTACSRLSTARNRAVWGLGCRSAGRLSKRMTDDCGRVLTCHVALSLASLRRLIRPPHGVPLRTMSVKPQWRPNSATQRDDAMCRRPKSVTSRSPVRSTARRLRHGDRAIGWLRAPGLEIAMPHCMWQTSCSSWSGQPGGGMSQDLLRERPARWRRPAVGSI